MLYLLCILTLIFGSMRVGNNLTKGHPEAGEIASVIADCLLVWVAVYVLIGQLK